MCVTASLGIQTLTKEYNNFDGSKKSGATGKTREESIKEDVTLIRKNTKPICLAAKNALKAQKEKLKTAKDAELRMREQSFGVTAKSFIDSVKGYQNAHVGYEEAVRSTMRRTLEYAVGDSMTSEEKEKVIDEGRAQQVCNDVMMNGRGEVANVYKDVTEQHNELVELAKSMNELRDMFQDMAALLEMQGENLNSIEGNMDTAQNYVDRGITHLDKANQYQKKKRKQMCCCMIIALGLAVGILTPILITALNNSR